jgi:prepilin-type N-terminal cleavage/methylation domain-containing protein
MRRRGGFTFIEVLVVMIVLGVLASIALLKYIDLRHRALSSAAAADLVTIRLAAYSQWYEHGEWAGEVQAGLTPPTLTPYLPGGFSFEKPEYTLDWENLGGPTPIAVVLTTTNDRLMKALQSTLGTKAPFIVTGESLTFVIVGPDGKI